jgi:hypothetical protein
MTQDSMGKIPSCMRQRGVMLHGGAYQRPTDFFFFTGKEPSGSNKWLAPETSFSYRLE